MGHGKIKLMLTYAIPPCWLAFIILQGAMKMVWRRENHLQSLPVNPVNYNYDWYENICSWVQGWHKPNGDKQLLSDEYHCTAENTYMVVESGVLSKCVRTGWILSECVLFDISMVMSKTPMPQAQWESLLPVSMRMLTEHIESIDHSCLLLDVYSLRLLS